ncbi:ABC transporter substrate-binding protein [Bradyrhizobium sp. Gha]|uniref:ABC transporter substrate-binding protein n=1 Tax=Bradyrhizobium sp. Gha TaxID=1855318 RepID=UPI000B824773|nr:ABC transporter substrate-binding protein [Bradyrhizobium sp. Gha]
MPSILRSSAFLLGFLTATGSFAAGKYDPGATDSEIRIGQTMSYSGPNSSFATIGMVHDGYFRKVNDEGGINGRKINFISYDDAFNPAKTVEQTRRLVESDQVLFTFGSLGTALQLAVQKYLNSKKVPQLFVSAASSKWEDPEHFPWTIGFVPSYRAEGRIYAKMILAQNPNAKIAIIYQNDDYGRDLLRGVKDGLGERSSMIVAEDSFEITEPTIDTHIVKLKASGADTLFDFTPPKFAAQAIRKVGELGWKPFHVLNTVSSSIGTVLRPAGFENAQGIVSTAYLRDVSDPRWQNDSSIVQYKEFIKKYAPTADLGDLPAWNAYGAAQTLIQVLKQCGDDLTRENVMRQVANIKGFHPDTLLPGIDIDTGPLDYAPMESLQLVKFEGNRWVAIGDVLSGQAEKR